MVCPIIVLPLHSKTIYMEEKIIGVVCYVGGNPKGVMTKKQFDNLNTRNWWDEIKTIQVPFDEWENVNIGNVKYFVKKYSV